ncbi:hypothetical protein BDV93DRAFT_506116 [Ceratobasidium sp. AG-I]|nr:hypothetical protein BDV93DRAFT_506116 [Ceratobasidium sp. AG-I]
MSRKRNASNIDHSGSDPWAPRIGDEQTRLPAHQKQQTIDPSLPVAGPSKRARTGPSTAATQPKIVERLTPKEKAEYVLDFFKDSNRYTIGDFLAFILNPETFGELDGTRKGLITGWIRSSSRAGTRPVDIVDMLYRHPSAIQRDNHIVRHASFSDLEPPFHPPTFTATHPRQVSLLPPAVTSDKARFNAREGLEEVMVRGTLCIVEREAARLAEDGLVRGANLTWEKAEDLSKSDQRGSMRTLAPVMWAIFSTIALNRNSSHTLDNQSSDGGSTEAKTKHRDPSLGIMMAISILISFRNPLVNFFQSIITVFLFACNTHKSVYRVLNRLGVSTAHSTLHGKHVVRDKGGNPAARMRESSPKASARARARSRTRECGNPRESRKCSRNCRYLRAERELVPQIPSHRQCE